MATASAHEGKKRGRPRKISEVLAPTVQQVRVAKSPLNDGTTRYDQMPKMKKIGYIKVSETDDEYIMERPVALARKAASARQLSTEAALYNTDVGKVERLQKVRLMERGKALSTDFFDDTKEVETE
jgi:hypothetical protein